MKPTVLAGWFATLLAVVVLATAVPAANQSQGQNPPKWWNSEPYRRELVLLPEQSKRLEEIFQAAVPTQKALKKALDDAEAQFERLVQKGDKQAATEQINRVVAARADLQKSHALMLLDMRWILTPDQWQKLGALNQAIEKQRAAEKSK
jgi:Spy/CpxP family protein refolding chaperone